MLKFRYLFIGLLAFLSLSCSVKKDGIKTNTDQSLLSNTWQIRELSGKQISDEVNGKVPTLLLDLEDNHYSVITGCNTLNGSFDLSKNKVKFFNGISTMMYCEDMSVEDGFKAILSKITSYEIVADELILFGGSERLVRLEKLTDKADISLVGTHWELDLLASPGIDFKKLFSEKKPSFEFLLDNRLSGNASCNRFNTSYKIEGNNISLGNIMSTKMMCQNLESERVFLNLLSKINRFSHSQYQLLFMIDDIVIMRFKKI